MNHGISLFNRQREDAGAQSAGRQVLAKVELLTSEKREPYRPPMRTLPKQVLHRF